MFVARTVTLGTLNNIKTADGVYSVINLTTISLSLSTSLGSFVFIFLFFFITANDKHTPFQEHITPRGLSKVTALLRAESVGRKTCQTGKLKAWIKTAC